VKRNLLVSLEREPELACQLDANEASRATFCSMA
jgi:hypothetical protein